VPRTGSIVSPMPRPDRRPASCRALQPGV